MAPPSRASSAESTVPAGTGAASGGAAPAGAGAASGGAAPAGTGAASGGAAPAGAAAASGGAAPAGAGARPAWPWNDGPASPWIGGRFVAGAGATIEDRSPATGALLAEVQLADAGQVDEAVAAATAAQREWARRSIRERAELIEQLADRLLERNEDFGLTDARDTGSPLTAMRNGARKGALYLKQLAGAALELQGRTVPASTGGWHVVKPEPYGVVGAIAAFNHPTLYACLKSGPALIAGNAVVLKPAEQAPLTALLFASLTDGLLPPGLLAVLPAAAEASAAITTHRDVQRISFTGSVEVALKIQEGIARAGRIKSVSLELGGKNPILVFPDADLDEAAAAVVRGMNYTRVQGQSCGSTSRLLAHESLVAPLTERILERVEKIAIGMPEDPATEMGSLISHAHRERVLGFVARAVAAGGELLAGGTPPEDPALAAGAFLKPTVIGGVRPDMELAAEEVYGPVLAIMSWREEAEAIELANATEYGLTASIWTRDLSRALRTADALATGYIWVNDVETRYTGVPFGGWKQSGVGTEQGLLADIMQATRPKAINIAVS
ncbi:aldehyde dehydrogenase family protein [Conexibacter woesei]|uniref:Aldehyde Dehydrogenase n=1 Tax=Conexibacter woesei (strain DSM 14684 / CCUG 47730 / CIP 108061 / JCM 11494 / NBRC 100937 / ID131577) TaxID=469383 RepID=D3F4Q1_CONWI|nr:aldehyde dehydrogenase family protein [Conexibacter woesei]ADB52508.1 Aldehyde Dehydrogenase [Conexibacter woesei DSM 14684]